MIIDIFCFYFQMKADDKSHVPKVRVAVIGRSNVGKSGRFIYVRLFLQLEEFLLKSEFLHLN